MLMSFLPFNLSTAVIFEKKGEEVNTISLMLKVAYKFAEKGFIVYILTKPFTGAPMCKDENLLQVNILERIHFRYFLTPKEIIQWCRQAHQLRRKPAMLLVSIKDFCKAEDFETLSLCAALLDVMIYFSKISNTKKLYFLGLVFIESNSYIHNLSSFFNESWLATMKYNSLELSSFQTKYDRNTFKLMVNDDSSFNDIQKIFLN